jgi:NAD+ kinase
MKLAVFGTTISDEFLPFLNEFLLLIKANGAQIQLYKPFAQSIGKLLKDISLPCSHFISHNDFDPENQLIFSIGGDGTFLQSVLIIRNFQIPVIGINSGRLGFLADISKDEIHEAVSQIFNRNYSVLDRTILEVIFSAKKNLAFNYALNEIAVVKSDTSSMINVYARVDGEFLNNYWADGLIVATPTGSTAYSLSVGGPILTPNSESIIITPLAPHGLTIRPMVIPDHQEITLKVEGRGAHFLTSVDTRSVALDFSTTLTIRKAKFRLKTISLHNHSFFNTLRNKLMWGIDKRN